MRNPPIIFSRNNYVAFRQYLTYEGEAIYENKERGLFLSNGSSCAAEHAFYWMDMPMPPGSALTVNRQHLDKL